MGKRFLALFLVITMLFQTDAVAFAMEGMEPLFEEANEGSTNDGLGEESLELNEAEADYTVLFHLEDINDNPEAGEDAWTTAKCEAVAEEYFANYLKYQLVEPVATEGEPTPEPYLRITGFADSVATENQRVIYIPKQATIQVEVTAEAEAGAPAEESQEESEPSYEDKTYFVKEIGTKAFYASNVRNNIREVVSLADLESIGDSAFYYCAYMKHFETLGATKEEAAGLVVSNNAFYNCSRLESISLENVKSIGKYSFQYCSTLTEFKQTTLETLDTNAFSGASKLETVEFSSSLTLIPESCFYNCLALKNIDFSNIETIQNNAFNNCQSLSEISLPELTSLGNKAFYYCTTLKTVSAAKLQTISSEAFRNCSTLKNTSFPVATKIDTYAFNNCQALENFSFANVSEIGNYAFQSCTLLKEAVAEELTKLGTYAFENNKSLEKIDFPNIAKVSSNALYNCVSLTSVNIPKATEVQSSSFANCKKLESVNLPEVITLGTNAFEGDALLSSVTAPKLTSVSNYAFKNCGVLAGFDFSKITSIGSYAFVGAKGITQVDAPELKTLSNNAFDSCINLVSVSMPKITSVGSNAFKDCTLLGTVIFADSITVNSGAFSGCVSLKTLGTSKIASVSNGAFSNCIGFEELDFSAMTSSSIPSSLCEGCTGLKKVIINGAKVKSIGNAAFKGCEKLTTIEGIDSVNSVDSNAFYNCKMLDNTLLLGVISRLTVISANSFYGCEKLEKVDLTKPAPEDSAASAPEVVTKINSKAFANCTGIKEVILNEKVTNIYEGAFSGCSALEKVVIPSNVTITWGEGAFSGCPLTDFSFPSSMKEIPQGLLSGALIKEIVIPDTITSINQNAFLGCTELTKVTLPNTMKSIYKKAFANCTKLESINIPKSLTRADTGVFSGDTELNNISFESDVTKLIGNLFSESSFKSITIPETVETIGNNSFINNKSLENVVIENYSVQFVSDTIFTKNDKLVIESYKGSNANAYANKNGIRFRAFSNIDATQVKFNDSSAEIMAGDIFETKVTFLPSYATNYSKLTYSSSDDSIAVVDENGIVTGVAAGSAVITATMESGAFATMAVTVTFPEMPEKLYAVANTQKNLADVTIPTEGWSFANKEQALAADAEAVDQSFDIVYTKTNGGTLNGKLDISISEVKNFTMNGKFTEVSTKGGDYIPFETNIISVGAPLDEKRYVVEWSSVNKNVSILDASATGARVIGLKGGEDTIVAELYILKSDGQKPEKEEGVNYWKLTKDIQVTEEVMIRGLFFAQEGLDTSVLSAEDPNHGFDAITMMPSKITSDFYIKAVPYSIGSDGELKLESMSVSYETSDKNVAAIVVDDTGKVAVNVKKEGVAKITATIVETGYSQSVEIIALDFMPRLSTEKISLNLYQKKPSADLKINMAYADFDQATIDDSSLKVLYQDKNGVVTDSEFEIAKKKDDIYTISLKDEAVASAKKGTKKVVIYARLKGGEAGTEIYYLPINISIIQAKPKLLYEQTACNPFYKDGAGLLTVTASEGTIASLSFVPSKPGVATLEAVAVEGAANKLSIVPNELLKNSYSKKYGNRGTLTVTFDGYSEAATVVVKNFKLSSTNTVPTATVNGSTKIYTELSDVAEVYVEEAGNMVSKKTGYAIDWASEKEKAKGDFSFEVTDEGKVLVKTLANKSGKITFRITSEKWYGYLDVPVSMGVSDAPKVSLSAKQVIINKKISDNGKTYVDAQVVGNNEAKITDISIKAKNDKDTADFNKVKTEYLANDGKLALSLADKSGLSKDIKINCDITMTVAIGDKKVDVCDAMTLILTEKEPSFAVKLSGKIDSVKRSSTYVTAAPYLKNVSGSVAAIQLEGTDSEKFTARYISSGKNKGKILIQAKTSDEINTYELVDKAVYKAIMNITLENGTKLSSTEFTIPVKQTAVKATCDVKNLSMISSLDGQSFGQEIKFKVSNTSDTVKDIILAEDNDAFGFDYHDDLTGIIYIKDRAAFAAKKKHKVRFVVQTYNTMTNAKPCYVTINVTNKVLKTVKSDKVVKVFGFNTEGLTFSQTDFIYYSSGKIEKLTGAIVPGYKVSNGKYEIINEKGKVAYTGSFETNGVWTIDKFSLMVGANTLRLSGSLEDGSSITEDYFIYCTTLDNIGEVDEKDDDGDGLANYLEDFYGTDKTNQDTDGDKLNDYIEVYELTTDPLKVDTDGNGISDYDEDSDGDGLSNGYEITHGLKPFDIDTDSDTLSDGDEVNGIKGDGDVVYHTDPLKKDTDGDGVDDNVELELGTDPTKADTSFTISVEPEGDISNGALPSITIPGLAADQVTTFEIDTVSGVDNALVTGNIPGAMSEVFEFSIDGTFQSAELTFKYSKGSLENPETAKPTVYYINEETQTLEPVNTIVNGDVITTDGLQVNKGGSDVGTATATLQHFSKYILLNSVEYDKVWNRDILPLEETKEGKEVNILFCIDDSGSMSSNDPKKLRKSLTENFIDQLSSKDKVATVGFTSSTTVYSEFTNDLEAAKESLSKLRSSGGTNIVPAVSKSLTMFDAIKTEDDSKIKKILFVLTDGQDNSTNSSYDKYIDQAKELGVTVYTVGFGNPNDGILVYLAENCNGTYYFATDGYDLADAYGDIIESVVDTSTDSNGDGISDYHTKLICEGKLLSALGTNPFAGIRYETIQKNADFDNDGLKNGEEVVVREVTISGETFVSLSLKSLPTQAYSDSDSYSDKEEVEMGTNPLVANELLKKGDVDYLVNSSNFIADNYRNQYNSKWTTQAGIWLGNLFGKNSKAELAKEMILDYMAGLNDGETAYQEDKALWLESYEFLKGVSDEISYACDNAQFFTKTESSEDACIAIWMALDDLSKMATKKIKSDKIVKLINDADTNASKLADKLTIKKEIKIGKSFSKETSILNGVDKTLKVVSVVTTAADIIGGSISTYTTIQGEMTTLQANIYILDLIIANTDNSFTEAGAKMLRIELATEQAALLSAIGGALVKAAFEITAALLEKAISAHPIGAAVLAVLAIADHAFKISDMAEAYAQVYVIAETGYILGNKFTGQLTSYKMITYKGNSYYSLIAEVYELASTKYDNLVAARLCEEMKMKETDESIDGFWFFKNINEAIYHEDWYDDTKITNNITKLKTMSLNN